MKKDNRKEKKTSLKSTRGEFKNEEECEEELEDDDGVNLEDEEAEEYGEDE